MIQPENKTLKNLFLYKTRSRFVRFCLSLQGLTGVIPKRMSQPFQLSGHRQPSSLTMRYAERPVEKLPGGLEWRMGVSFDVVAS